MGNRSNAQIGTSCWVQENPAEFEYHVNPDCPRPLTGSPLTYAMGTEREPCYCAEGPGAGPSQPTTIDAACGGRDKAPDKELGEELEVPVRYAVSGVPICSVRLRLEDTVGTLRRNVALIAGKGFCEGLAFDLLFNGQVLENSASLAAALGSSLHRGALEHGAAVEIVRRRLCASDISVAKYSERALGCIRFIHKQSGAELLLRGVRCGLGKGASPMSVEFYSDPAFVEDGEDGCVSAHYVKVVGEYRADHSVTRHVQAMRPLRTRDDVVVARASDGDLWVSFRPEKLSADGIPRDIYSGARLEVLGSFNDEFIHVRCPSRGDGSVHRRDLEGLGELCLDWAGPEVVIGETFVH